MTNKEYNERIEEKIQEIADGRITQYEEAENIVSYVVWLTEQQLKREITERINNAKYLKNETN